MDEEVDPTIANVVDAIACNLPVNLSDVAFIFRPIDNSDSDHRRKTNRADSLTHTMETISQALAARRRDLQAELNRLTEPPEEGVSVGFGKRVGDGTSVAVERLATTATARSIAASIKGIDRAFVKIEAGTYGTCEHCGKPIGEARLEALPASIRCVQCASLP